MKKTRSSAVSLGDVAKAAGVSKAAAHFALRNRPGVSEATRARICRLAAEMGYSPDARMSSRMAGVQEAGTKELLPIAWLNNDSQEEDAWRRRKYLSPYLEGARECCRWRGYRLEEIWTHQPGMTIRRIANMLYQRGIEGVIVTLFVKHMRLNWDCLAGVSLEGTMLAPRLHCVGTDHASNLLLALRNLRRYGYRRIGVCFDEAVDRRTNHVLRALAHDLNSMRPKSWQVPPLFYTWGNERKRLNGAKQAVEWMKRHTMEVVVGHSNQLLSWARAAGYRVPEEMGVVHLANDDDVRDWTGVCSNRREIGAVAANLVITMIQNRQFGVPKTTLNTFVSGTWCPGRTLLIPRPPD